MRIMSKENENIKDEELETQESQETQASPEMQETMWTHGVSGKGSSGLGLAFVKRVAERFGAYVKIESEQGKGSKIALWIPEEEETDER